MKNIIGYAETEMRTLAEKEFCAVDSLILSQLSYARFEGMVPPPSRAAKPVRIAELLRAEMFPSMFRGFNPGSNRALLFALAASPRFRNIRANYYVSETDAKIGQQFSATTFLLGDEKAYIAFRGTDESLVGWKEDFNMAVTCPVPSQKEAAAYLNEVAAYLPHSFKLITGGHSKGGNLATYAAMKCRSSVRNRIVSIYNHDGPGFREEVTRCPEFKEIEGRIRKTLPKASLIGLLLYDRESYSIVKSDRIVGIMQHDPFSWSIGDGDFVYADRLTTGARAMSKALHQWLGRLSDEKRKIFVDTMFQVLEAADVTSLTGLSEKRRKGISLMIASIKNIDPEIKKTVSRAVNDLIRLSLKSLRTDRAPAGAD